MLSLKALGEDPFWSLVASGGGHSSLVFFGSQLHHSNLSLHCHMALPLCVYVSVSKSPFPYEVTSHRI